MAKWVRYPLCDTISKGHCAIWGVSRTGPLRALSKITDTGTACRGQADCSSGEHGLELSEIRRGGTARRQPSGDVGDSCFPARPPSTNGLQHYWQERKNSLPSPMLRSGPTIASPNRAGLRTFRKILAPIKNKIGPSPPQKKPKIPPSPKTRNFMDMVFPAEWTLFFQASIKLAQPFPAPELRTEILRTRRFF